MGSSGAKSYKQQQMDSQKLNNVQFYNAVTNKLNRNTLTKKIPVSQKGLVWEKPSIAKTNSSASRFDPLTFAFNETTLSLCDVTVESPDWGTDGTYHARNHGKFAKGWKQPTPLSTVSWTQKKFDFCWFFIKILLKFL